MSILKHILQNPISYWIKRAAVNIFYEIKYSKSHLSLGYLTHLTNCKFGRYNHTQARVVLCDVCLGDFSYVAENSKLNSVQVGKYCSIGPNVVIGLGVHPSRNFVSTHPIFFSTNHGSGISFVRKACFEEIKPITVGNDVWIGAGAIILDGIVIGDGAIVAAGAVVTKDIPAYAVVGGVPAKVIKYRFTQDEIDALLISRWWGRDVEWLRENASTMTDVGNFLGKGGFSESRELV